MMRRGVVVGAVAVVLAWAGGHAAAAPVRAEQPDIVERLEAIDGMTVESEQDPPGPGYRLLMLSYEQPVDHRNPDGATFTQRAQLLHRGFSRPTVLHTTGYNMPQYGFRDEPTELVDGNQLSVEQRFFQPSRPEPADWTTLDIWQAATDHHRLVEAFESIYRGNWISTGSSRGGMATVYHRRFYPGDVDGTVAYVTPNDVHNRDDSAYDDFLGTVGTPECRQALTGLQRAALSRRGALVERYEQYARERGLTFDAVLGSADRAFETAVLDTAWGFWQHFGEDDCAAIPPPSASDGEIFDFLDRVSGFSSGLGYYADETLQWLAPYYYQAATQLGWPEPEYAELDDLRRYSDLQQANSSLRPELRSPHDPRPMIDIATWVRTRSSEMLYVNGSDDPWSAESFRPSRHDSHRLTADGGNHDTDIAALAPEDADTATRALRRWAGLDPDAQVDAPPAAGRTPAPRGHLPTAPRPAAGV